MTPDWMCLTTGPLPDGERRVLLSLLWEAHRQAAHQNAANVSNVVAASVAEGSHDVGHAIAAAILSTGGMHAPVTRAREFLFSGALVKKTPGVRVPGFGNSFYPDVVDPAWVRLDDYLKQNYPTAYAPVAAWSVELGLPPNAAAFTALVAELVGWPRGTEILLVIQPRLVVWAVRAFEAIPDWRLA